MDTMEPGIIAFFILGPLLIVDCWVIYMACVCTDRLESHLPNSVFISANRNTFSSAGFVGNIVRNGVLVLVLVFPVVFARKGFCDFAEIKAFPAKEKLHLLAAWGAMLFLILALVIFHLWMNY
ncbi:hypothetical protein [Pseudomonas sp. LB3P31]